MARGCKTELYNMMFETQSIDSPAVDTDADTSPFQTLGLSPALLRALVESGYTTPTPIQVEAIPLALAATTCWRRADRHRQTLHSACRCCSGCRS